MRHIRYRDSSGVPRIAIGQPATIEGARIEYVEANEPDFVEGATRGFTPSYRTVSSDAELLKLSPDFTLMTPLDPPELWCVGANYPASWRARVSEAEMPEPYELLLDDRRPHFYFKDARGLRTVAPGEPIAIRSDATWTVPEPEIGVVIGEKNAIIGYTIVNDVSCRDIRGASPLYLSQAKTHRASCAMGPAIYVDKGRRKPFTIYLRVTDAEGRELFTDKTSTKEMRRPFGDLVDWLARENPIAPGTVLATGAAIVPPNDFTLQPGQIVEVHVPEIGTLSNPVVLVSDLELSELAERRRPHPRRRDRVAPARRSPFSPSGPPAAGTAAAPGRARGSGARASAA
ncbi:MAG: fumarylacetoacetate hydrolase [Actinobacteria bacterium]|nr:fumarylacetoacetate hydrolase [Actinomycetota bacterium]